MDSNGACRRGFIFIEILLGITLFGLLVVSAFLIMFLGQSSSIASGDRFRAIHLAERALDAAYSIREEDFLELQAGTHGIALGADGTWELFGSETVTSDGYTIQLAITSLASDWVALQADVHWDHGTKGAGTVTLHRELTNWRAPVDEAWDPNPPEP
ncbi:hypothetical protein COU77_01950 [Candidatus Peregrinibacteria bacterium CG10_big_fil_rev_8_21_14_0_10_49_16]|nr:MAG: hypothetical protein COW95_02755 [Candidatus Peregrinibacteria bacterium CG22_combo_CG10-13_8_21_14_all_49_11]PIR52150.1 MAG: hypothetical protein COU77_01950 [Candidatus Peregrinibacteria bacterium CG10_big_fil_rev_8_21_14_0_10_49_16]